MPSLTNLTVDDTTGAMPYGPGPADTGADGVVPPPAEPQPDVNSPPVAVTDRFTTPFGQSLVIPVADLLANDTDPDGDALIVTQVVEGEGGVPGTAVLDPAAGTVTFTPDPGFTGGTGFFYTISDGQGGTDIDAFIVTVGRDPNAPVPVAVADAYPATEDMTLTVPAGQGVLANDEAQGEPALFAELGDGPDHFAEFTFGSDGSFTYVPQQNFAGTDTFTYTARGPDGAPLSQPATVTINVAPVNDAPVAFDAFAAFALSGEPLTTEINPAATDVDSTELTYNLVPGSEQSGTVILNQDGTFTFTSAPGFTGVATFDYTVSDDQGATSEPATVSVTVREDDAPPQPPVPGREFEGTRGPDTITGTEGPDTIDGGRGNDDISGLGGNDLVEGGRGNDTIRGGAGDDTIEGGRGSDSMEGGAGADTFLFDNGLPADADTVADFQFGIDVVELGGGIDLLDVREEDVDGDGTLDTVLDFGADGTATLLGVNLSTPPGDLFTL